MIQIHSPAGSWLCASSASLFKRTHELIEAMKGTALRDVVYTIGHHSGIEATNTTFDHQTVLAFEFSGADYSRVQDGVNALAHVLKAPSSAAIVTAYGRTTQVLFHLKTPVRKRQYFTQRRGAYLEACQRWASLMREQAIVAEVNMELFEASAVLPLPGTTYKGKAVELLHYSDAVLDLDLPKRRPPVDHILPYARAALLEWSTDNLIRTDDPADFIPAATAYETYIVWCAEQQKRPMTRNTFGKSIGALYPCPAKEKKRWHDGRVRNGYSRIRLRSLST